MRNIIFALTAVMMMGSLSSAAVAKKKVKAKKPNLTQEAVFNGAVVHGKYQVAGGAVSAVENEKTLNDLVGGRKNFKDRMKQDLADSKQAPKQDPVQK